MTDAFKERLDNALAADPAALTAPRLLRADDELEVRALGEPRPVPPLLKQSSTTRASAVAQVRPVYDPFSARRRRSPEWLVAYTAALVAGDIGAAGAAACALLPVTNPISAHGLGLAVIGMLAWPALLMSLGTYAERLHGTGATEYRRVGVGGVIEIAVAGFAARFPRSRR
jgi:hypothetical protein